MPYQKQVWPDATKQDSLGAKLNNIETGIFNAQAAGEGAQTTANTAVARIQTAATAPTPTTVGQLWYDTTTGTMRVWNGSDWRIESYPALVTGSNTGGSVLQVRYSATATQVFITSTVVPQTTLIGLSGTITPRSTTSRIIVQLVLQMRTIGSGSGAGIRVLRNASTAVGFSDAQNYAIGYTNAAQTPSGKYAWTGIDSPATTSATTYAVYASSYAATGVDFQDDGQFASTMLLWEIA